MVHSGIKACEWQAQTSCGLLEKLKDSNKHIGLASSSSREFIELVLNNLNVRHYFEVVVSGDDVCNSKPAPDIFLRAAELLEVDPSQCIVIEDSEHGVKAAKLAGMKCIGFINPNSGSQNLSEADIIVDSIDQIDEKQL